MSASRSPACVRVSSWFWSSCGTTDVTVDFFEWRTQMPTSSQAALEQRRRDGLKKKKKHNLNRFLVLYKKLGVIFGKTWQKILDQFSHWPKESVEILYIGWRAVCWMGITIKIFGFIVVFCYTDALQRQISQVSKSAFFFEALHVIERRSTKNKSPPPFEQLANLFHTNLDIFTPWHTVCNNSGGQFVWFLSTEYYVCVL